MDFNIFVTKGLGDNSYILSSDGKALLIDPQRDVARFTSTLKRNDLELVGVLESHVHNDYISGALELNHEYNIPLYLPGKGDYEFEHTPVTEGFSLNLGKLTVEVIDTPGHTYEHISWIVKQGGKAINAFTGGSLIVGSAGRTDLLGEDHTHQLTSQQYETIQKLKSYPDEMRILPTHGAGSFCASTNPSDTRTSTLGSEKRYNQAVTASNIEEFFERQLKGLPRYPSYYKYMAGINRKGPIVYGEVPKPPGLDIEEFRKKADTGIVIVDTRDRLKFAKAHIPNSYNFELKPDMSNYLGWILPFNAPMILIVEDPADVEEVSAMLLRIGYETIHGYLEGGIETWINADMPVATYDPISVLDMVKIIKSDEPVQIIDVRQETEYQERHIYPTTNIFVADIIKNESKIPKDVHIFCVSGQRAAIASSILKQYGHTVNSVHDGGINEIMKLLN